MSQIAALIGVAFSLKMICVGTLAKILNRRLRDFLGSILAAWTVLQLLITASMLLLSWRAHLNTAPLWGATILIGISLILVDLVDARRHGSAAEPLSDSASPGLMIALLFLLIISLTLLYRSLYVFDNTWDSLTYELPRLEFWKSAHSLFIHQATAQVNIFTNEWNGELNSLFYYVLTASAQATSFGGVEVWALSAVVFTWLSRGCDIDLWLSLLLGVSMAATPALLGLAAVVKGDLLACVSFGVAIGWIVRILPSRQNTGLRSVLAMGALGLALGSKIALAGSVIILAGFLALRVISAPGERRRRWLVITSGIVTFFVGCLRYVLNFLQYGTPIYRTASERADFSWEHLQANLVGLAGSVINPLAGQSDSVKGVWVLSVGMGGMGAVFVVSLVFTRCTLPKRYLFDWAVFAAGLAFGFGIAVSAIPWNPWSFRYFVPWIYPAVVYTIAAVLQRLSPVPVGRASFFAIGLAATHLVFMSRPGEFMPGPTPAETFAQARNSRPLERKLALHPYLLAGPDGVGGLVIGKKKSVLVYNQLDSAIEPFFGENNQNVIQLVARPEDLVQKCASSAYDIVAITGPRLPNEPTLWKIMLRNGYQISVDSDFWRVGGRIQPR